MCVTLTCCKIEPYLTAYCVCSAVPLQCGLGFCSRTVVVFKATAIKQLYNDIILSYHSLEL